MVSATCALPQRIRAIAPAVIESNRSAGLIDGSAKKTMKIVTRIGSPRQISMYARMSARSGRNLIVSSVPSVIPTRELPTSAIADSLSVFARPTSSM